MARSLSRTMATPSWRMMSSRYRAETCLLVSLPGMETATTGSGVATGSSNGGVTRWPESLIGVASSYTSVGMESAFSLRAKTLTGRCTPFMTRSWTGVQSTRSWTAANVRSDTSIWPGSAAVASRAATLT